MRALLASVAVVLAGLGGLWLATDEFAALTTETSRRIALAENRPLVPPLVLEEMSGRTMTLRSAEGKVTVVEFIYTTCPTICRAAGDYMAQLRDRLVEDGLVERVRSLSISFDPLNDGPTELAAYGQAHDADGTVWTIARPLAEDLPRLLESFGVQVIDDGMGGYEHNAAIHIVDPEGRLTAIFDIDDIEGAAKAVAASR